LFKSDTALRLGSLALRALQTFAPDAKTFAEALELPPQLADTILRKSGSRHAGDQPLGSGSAQLSSDEPLRGV